jgi:uncharacterized membrane protein
MNAHVITGHEDPNTPEGLHSKPRREQCKVRRHRDVNPTVAGAIRGGCWGAFVGLLFLHPLLGIAVGAASGAVRGAVRRARSDPKINDGLATELSEQEA